MILITGGLGCIGSHTARGLLDLGESWTQHCACRCPDLLIGDLGKTVFIDHLGVNDQEAFL
jgi:UDP-glucose 4-epimerase